MLVFGSFHVVTRLLSIFQGRIPAPDQRLTACVKAECDCRRRIASLEGLPISQH